MEWHEYVERLHEHRLWEDGTFFVLGTKDTCYAVTPEGKNSKRIARRAGGIETLPDTSPLALIVTSEAARERLEKIGTFQNDTFLYMDRSYHVIETYL